MRIAAPPGGVLSTGAPGTAFAEMLAPVEDAVIPATGQDIAALPGKILPGGDAPGPEWLPDTMPVDALPLVASPATGIDVAVREPGRAGPSRAGSRLDPFAIPVADEAALPDPASDATTAPDEDVVPAVERDVMTAAPVPDPTPLAAPVVLALASPVPPPPASSPIVAVAAPAIAGPVVSASVRHAVPDGDAPPLPAPGIAGAHAADAHRAAPVLDRTPLPGREAVADRPAASTTLVVPAGAAAVPAPADAVPGATRPLSIPNAPGVGALAPSEHEIAGGAVPVARHAQMVSDAVPPAVRGGPVTGSDRKASVTPAPMRATGGADVGMAEAVQPDVIALRAGPGAEPGTGPGTAPEQPRTLDLRAAPGQAAPTPPRTAPEQVAPAVLRTMPEQAVPLRAAAGQSAPTPDQPAAIARAAAAAPRFEAAPSVRPASPAPTFAAAELATLSAAAVAPARRFALAEPSVDALAQAVAQAVTGADARPVVAAPNLNQVPLDMRDTRWPGHMIEHIEMLRDGADAVDSRIRLLPDALGPVEVSVRRDGDRVHVHFAAEQPAARAMLNEAQPRLAEIADTRGLKLGQTSVGSGGAGGSGGSPAGSGAGSGRQPAPHSPARPRPHARAAGPRADDIRIA